VIRVFENPEALVVYLASDLCMGFHPFGPFGANLRLLRPSTARRNFGAISPSNNRSRFLVELEVTHTANAVEGLQQHRAQQALRRYRGAATPRWIKLRKIAIHIRKSCVDDLPNRPRADLWVSTEPVTVLPSASY